MKNIEKKINEIIDSLTLDEKIGQLTQRVFSKDNVEQIKKEIRNGEIGSLILATSAHAGNDKQEELYVDMLNEIQRTAVEESRAGIPIIYGRDVIHGHRTVYPMPLASAASFDPELIEKCYSAIAEEASDDSIHWTFSPMVDLSRDARWGRCVEGPGEDPYVGEKFACAAVKGFQGDDMSKSGKLAACAKHYVGYGASEGGRDYHRTEISDYTLRNYYLRAFRGAAKAGVATVMSSFNEISGQPTTSSKYLLTDVLKDEFGFDGFIVSDWNAVRQLMGQGVAANEKECAKLAMNAGLDMDMVDDCYSKHLKELAESGEVSTDVIDESVRRILRIKMRLGLFDKPYAEKISYDRDAHEALAKKIAGETAVLLKNSGGLLPLDKNKKVALVGPMVHERRIQLGSWTLDCDISRSTTLYEAFCALVGKDNVITPDSVSYDEAVMACRGADVVIAALGESHQVTGEARSLADIDLPSEQVELLKKLRVMGKPIVGLLNFGRAVALQEAELYMDAILYCWHSGTKAADAAAELVFGDTVPSGKLPVTIPRVTGQIPIYYNASSSGRRVNGYYGEEIESYNYEDCLGSPMYPFGFGLSYTDFEYSSPRADKASLSLSEINGGAAFEISVNLKNIGSVDACETVQCYIRDVAASQSRSIRELKGYKRTAIKAGTETTVSFTLGFEKLAFYNALGALCVEAGEFEVYVGGNCLASECIKISVTE